MFAANTDGMCLVTIADANNERIAGASIELAGTRKVFYTNINGMCYVPKALLSKTGKVIINSISYKTIHLNADDLNSKIILESR